METKRKPRLSSTSGDDLCPVCSETVEILAVGRCDHAICYRCSTRMRVLCEQMYCAICRTDLPKVVFLKELQKFETINTSNFNIHRQHKIYFSTDSVQEAFSTLLQHKCPLCPDIKPFRSFDQLSVHMKRQHQLFYCELCVEHLKIFSHERKAYDRKHLALHKRRGDPDDRSHKGHPLCPYCDEHHLDADELARHLRKDHYFCDFCEHEGIFNVFYCDYTELASHFSEEHFLCEEGDCATAQFTNAFASEIDFKAHKATMHTKNLRKAQAKQARTLDIEYNLVPRPSQAGRRGGPRDRKQGEAFHGPSSDSQGRGRGRGRTSHREEVAVAQAVAASLTRIQKESGSVAVLDRALLENPMTASQPAAERSISFREECGDFPNLDGTTKEPSQMSEPAVGGEKNMARKFALDNNYSVQDGGMTSHDFPALGAMSSSFDADLSRSRSGSAKPQPSGQPASKVPGSYQAPPSKPQPSKQPASKGPASYQAPPSKSDTSKQPPSKGPASYQPPPSKPQASKQPASKPKSSNQPSSQPPKEQSVQGSQTSQAASSWGHHTPDSWRSSVGELTSGDFPSLGDIGSALLGPSKAISRPSSTASTTSACWKPSTQAASSNSAKPLQSDFPSLSKGPTKKGGRAGRSNNTRVDIHTGSNRSTPGEVAQGTRSEGSSIASEPVRRVASSSALSEKVKEDFPPLGGKESTQSRQAQWGRPQSGQSESSSNDWIKKQRKGPKHSTGTAESSGGTNNLKKQQERQERETKKQKEKQKREEEHKRLEEKLRREEEQTKKEEEQRRNEEQQRKEAQQKRQEQDKRQEEQQWREGRKKKKEQLKKEDGQQKTKDQKEVEKSKNELSSGSQENLGEKSKSKKKKKQKNAEQKSELAEEPPVVDYTAKLTVNNQSAAVSESSKETDRMELEKENQMESGSKQARDENKTKAAPLNSKEDVEKFMCDLEETIQDKIIATKVKKPEIAFTADDFPSLGAVTPQGVVTPLATTPGWGTASNPTVSSSVKPPPGFGLASSSVGKKPTPKPPPGFEGTMGPAVYNGIMAPSSKYIPPKDSDSRNIKLINSVQNLFKDDNGKFTKFKLWSCDFRQDELDAGMYYEKCCSLLGEEKFRQLFPELLSLLPDIAKQQGLLTAHMAASAGVGHWNPHNTEFMSCHACGQVLLETDYSSHLSSHDLDSDFPALGMGSHT